MEIDPDGIDKFHSRRRRFERRCDHEIRLTVDDLAIFRYVARHRFLRSTHIVQLLPDRSPRKLIERLCDLYHAGYLDRPRAQLEFFARAGSAPMVYALGNRGAWTIVAHDPSVSLSNDWTDKNRAAKRPYIEHALLIADFMVALETSVRQRSDIALVDASSLLAELPAETRRSRNPWSLTGEIWHGTTRHVIPAAPDAVFALDFEETGRRSFFFVEADRATMPIERSDLAQSSYRRKLLAYLAAHKARQHIERLGFSNLRVLTVTTSVERVAAMIAAVRDTTKGRGTNMFLFTDAAMLSTHRELLSMPWCAATGTVSIDQPPRGPH